MLLGKFDITVALAMRDAPHAVEAARRFAALYPGVVVKVSENFVCISGVGEADDLNFQWRTILLNERLVSEADRRRAELLKSLVA